MHLQQEEEEEEEEEEVSLGNPIRQSPKPHQTFEARSGKCARTAPSSAGASGG